MPLPNQATLTKELWDVCKVYNMNQSFSSAYVKELLYKGALVTTGDGHVNENKPVHLWVLYQSVAGINNVDQVAKFPVSLDIANLMIQSGWDPTVTLSLGGRQKNIVEWIEDHMLVYPDHQNREAMEKFRGEFIRICKDAIHNWQKMHIR